MKKSLNIKAMEKLTRWVMLGNITQETLREWCIKYEFRFSSIRNQINRMLSDKGKPSCKHFFVKKDIEPKNSK